MTIATDIPGCTDLISPGRTGMLFPVDDVGALTEKLRQSASPEVRASLVRNAREFVVANYSATAMAARYQQLYRGLLKSVRGVSAEYG